MKHHPAFVALCEAARGRIREVTLPEYEADPGAWILVDVREESEFAAFRIPDARHLGKGIVERDVCHQHPTDAPLLLYCGGGYRSALAADNLQQMGMTRVASLAGGIKAHWASLARGLGTRVLPSLSLRAPHVVAGDVHVAGDLDVREPLVVGGTLRVDGHLEARSAIEAARIVARTAVFGAVPITGSIVADAVAGPTGEAEVRGQTTFHDVPLRPGTAADAASVVRAIAAGVLEV
jgi:rhodanese-related sulfurtransferase